MKSSEEMTIETNDGDFDYTGFEIAQMDFITARSSPTLSMENGAITFSIECLRKIPNSMEMQLLIHPEKKELAVRPAPLNDRHSIRWAKRNNGAIVPRTISTAAFSGTLFSLLGWDEDHKYRMHGKLLKKENEEAMIFTTMDASILIRKDCLEADFEEDCTPLESRGKRVAAVPENMAHAFGKSFYEEKSMADLIRQTAEEWKISLEGRLCSTGIQLNITPYEELKAFIQEELGDLFWEDNANG